MSSTPEFGIQLPNVGASKNTWGEELNSALEEIDLLIHQLSQPPDFLAELPSGAIIYWHGDANNVPSGWRLINIYNYYLLGGTLSQIGQYHGGVPATTSSGGHSHELTANTVLHDHGGTSGATAISINEMPSHNHGGGPHSHSGLHGRLTGSGSSSIVAFQGAVPAFQYTAWDASDRTVDPQGGGNPHSHGLTAADGNHTHGITAQGDHTHSFNPPTCNLIAIVKI